MSGLFEPLARLTDDQLLQRFFQLLTPDQATARAQLQVFQRPGNQWTGGLSNEQQMQLQRVPLAYACMLASEYGRRIASRPTPIIGRVYSSQQIGRQLVSDFLPFRQEQLVLLCLDTKNQIVQRQVIFQGTLNSCTVHPREIFACAVRNAAAKIAIAHNHPSGNPQPSANDLHFTQRLQACGKMMGIELLDSFIIGQEHYFSFAEENLLLKSTSK